MSQARPGRRRLLLTWGLAALLIGLFLAKLYVADVYWIESGSMQPTLFGAPSGGSGLRERVLVAYDRAPEVDRFDLVVMRSRDGGRPLVKRVGGLPGESVLVSEGDLLVGGERLGARAPRPPAVAVFDDRLLDVGNYFSFKDTAWNREGAEWALDASDVPRDTDAGMMFFDQHLSDGYLDPKRGFVGGSRRVNDGILECEVLLQAEADGSCEGRLRFHLLEQGDTFQALIEPGEEGFHLVLRRRNASIPRGFELLYEGPLPFESGRWHRVLFANVDNHLSFELDDVFRAGSGYGVNERYPGPTGEQGQSIGYRAGFGAEGGRARFRSIVVLRDLFYTQDGEYAVTSLLTLGPDEYFLLGDNSDDSTDSRHFGPVRAEEIVGVPVAVVWPVSRFRWLESAARR